MSTWTSERRAPRWLGLSAALTLFLAGCFEAAPLSRFSARDATPGPASVVVNGGVTVSGPEGYCVDTSSTVEGESEAFVLLIRCRADAGARPVLAATVTALPAEAARGDANLAALKEALTGEAGRGHLSRSGRAEDVRIDAASIRDGAVWLRIHDRSSPEAFAPDYWRAILPAGGRVVTLSALGGRTAPVEAEAALAVLREFTDRMRTSNQD